MDSGRRRGGATTRRWTRALAITLLGVAAISCSDMALKPEAPVLLSGTILGRDGEPLEAVRLEFTDLDWAEGSGLGHYGSTRIVGTNSSGVFSTTLAPGRYWVRIYPPSNLGYPSRYAELVLRSGPSRFDLTFTGFRVMGIVNVPGGALLSYGRASVHSESLGAETLIRSGTFSFVLPAATYRFRIIPYEGPSIPTVLFTGVELRSDTTLTLPLDGHAITGHATGPAGAPLAGASISAEGERAEASTLTASDGSYRLYLPTDVYTLSVAPGFQDAYIASRGYPGVNISGPQTIDFNLGGVTWTGTVRRTGSGEPEPFVTVSAVSYGPGFLTYSRAKAIAGSAGEFRLVLKPYNWYYVNAHSSAESYNLEPGAVQLKSDSTFDLYVTPEPNP